jgi:hypothetical protein
MSDSGENRVASAKTSRGSQDPNRCAGYAAIVQPAPCDAQSSATLVEVTRVLEVGRLLRSALTPAELAALDSALRAAERLEALTKNRSLRWHLTNTDRARNTEASQPDSGAPP